ncbi:hypothetical protein QTI51_24610 [Variovorax sp. J22G73]|uniref:hypothetical protein n=1 Tax=unclassified Variovorax TaxID=663243 RepID=UPI0025772A31|nr:MULTISPECIES: hypothetical protein [unclassified Variovorax]MDM0007895.1 hypothetical protein [Variovorax sp. J22R203]MDM0100482.1 hypothetical protein [Variovorax sp. J22G73]
MSLLDFLNTPDAQLGLGLLAAGGPSTQPMSFGQRIAQGVQYAQSSKDADLRRQYVRSQIDENAAQIAARNLQAQRDQAINGLVMGRVGGLNASVPGAAAGNGTPVIAPGVQSAGAGGVGTQGAGAILPGGPLGGSRPGAGVASGSGTGAAFPFSLDDITALQGFGYKGADGLFNMYKYATDGVKREAGNYYQDPRTGEVRYMPKLGEGQTIGPNGDVVTARGYDTSNANIKGRETQASEAARYPFTVGADRSRQLTQAALDPQTYVGDDDNSYSGTRLQGVMASGGGPLIGLPPQAAQGGGATTSAGPLIGRELGGGAGTARPFMTSRNPVTQQSRIALNDNWIKNSYQPTVESGRAASDALTNVQALRSINMNTGWGAEAKASAAGVLAGLGVAPASVEMFAANAQKFQSVAMDRLMKKQVEQKGTATEGDAKRIGQTYVALQNTPAANDFILDLAQAQANQDQRRAQFYEAALPLAQKAGDLTRVDREWRKIQGSIWADPTLQRWSK